MTTSASRVQPERPGEEFALNLRIPGWTRNQPVPGDLYRYLGPVGDPPELRVAGEPVKLELQNGFAPIRRAWQAGDVVELNLPMPVRRVAAHEAVKENAGQVALERGPIVYCVEWPDVQDGEVLNPTTPGRIVAPGKWRSGWRPRPKRRGTTEWVQYDFGNRFQDPVQVSAVEVYWLDDTGHGDCRIPASWRILYREDGQWKPVTGASGYGLEKDQFNRTTFDPVRTDALRLEIQLPRNHSAGILEWKVE